MPASSAVEAGSQDQDRVAVVHVRGALVLVLADGAGGRGGGREAAEGVVRLARDKAHALVAGTLDPVSLLTEIDSSLASDKAAGESTAVLAIVAGSEVFGASVGDSGAWLLNSEAVTDLTRAQVRKPMVGSGSAMALAFGPVKLEGRRLLLASDGLLKYAGQAKIQKTALSLPVEEAALALIEAVRFPSGNLPDDISVILFEER